MKQIKLKIKEEKYKAAFLDLMSEVRPEQGFPEQFKISRLLQKIPNEELGLKPIKVALLTTSTVDHLAEILRLYLAKEGYSAEFYISEYGTIYQTALNPESELYAFNPDIIWTFINYRDLDLVPLTSLSLDEAAEEVAKAIEAINSLVKAIQRQCGAQIIINNSDRPLEREFGNLDVSLPCSRTALIQRFNLELGSSVPSGVLIFDLSYIAEKYGLQKWHDETYWHHSKHAFSLNAAGFVAHSMAKLIRGARGESRKCLVLDLDNTLWGGVIGDDGIEGIVLGQGNAEGEAFIAFQHYLKALKNRGVILAVCSKNQEEIASEAFRSHPEMVLQLEDFSAFICNWQNKADNIRDIADILEIGLESFVFVDDNPVERAQVRTELPIVAVPELPEDPAYYLRTLDQESYFEITAFSEEDKNRSAMYNGNAQRKVSKNKFSDIEGFLTDLSMKAQIGKFDQLNLPRISQLINKSNQFHLTTTRYSEIQLRKMISQKSYEGLWFKLQDRFGDNGLIAVIILHQIDDVLEVDTWAMSCRVLSRGVEDLVHNEIVNVGKERGVKKLRGRYIPTKKNKIVANLYGQLNWLECEHANTWEIAINDALLRKNYIERLS